MRRLIVLHYTGEQAVNLAMAHQVARKIRGTARTGQCVLVDFEDVSPSLPFLRVVAAEIRPEKVKVCGLSRPDQMLLKQLTSHLPGNDSE